MAAYNAWKNDNPDALETGQICQDERYENFEEGPGKHMDELCTGKKAQLTGCTHSKIRHLPI